MCLCAQNISSTKKFRPVFLHQPDGTYLEVPAKPKLQKDVVPRFLPGCPLHLSSSSDTIPPRFDRSLREQHLIDTAINESILQYNQDKELVQITTLEDLVSKAKHSGLPNHWLVWFSDDNSFNLLKPSITNNSLIAIQCSLTITETLHTIGFYEGIRILLSLTQINDIRQLNDLLKEIENHSAPTNSPETFQHHVREATGSIRKAIDSLSTGEESGNQQPVLSSLQFILCQLDNALIAKTMRRYNIETLVLFLKCQLISPVCYRYLQSLECLSLPHLSTLKRLYSNFGLDSEFINYLKQLVTQFNKWERNVVIQMDEIHVKSTFTYKGGKIIGSSLNPTDPAKTVFAFMVSSLSKRWSSIVRLLPCSSSSAEVLFLIIKEVIRDVEACGLSVHVLCIDNYPMNVNIFKLFSPSRLLEHIVLLQRVVDWAECWQLSPQTFTSFRHSCIALPCVVNHLTGNCGYSYVLSSFLQNDPLEHHFGLYRMMSGAQYHIRYCQVLETERRIKLSSILKLFSKKPVEYSIPLKNFLESCSSSCDQDSHASFSLETYLSAIQGYSEIELNKLILQSLSFIAGYSVHAYYKHSTKCQSCFLFLTENKEMEIEEPSDSEYRLIQIIDQGSLKWPSSDVIDAIITLWKVFSSIESQPRISNNFITGPSRSILIQLTTSLIEDEQAEVWRVMCDECGTLLWDVLAKLLTTTSNCLISNKIKNMNCQLPLKPCVENTRKLKKLKPN